MYAALAPFKKGGDAGTTFDAFEKYVKRAEMVFATEDIQENAKKKAFLQLWGGDDMMTLFEHEGKVVAADTFEQAVDKVKTALKGQINEVYPVYKLFCEMPQGKKSFSDWYPAVMDQAKLCNFDGYNAKRAARDAMAMQTSNHKLRKQALAEGLAYPDFIKYGLVIEASNSQADTIEKAESGVNRLRIGQERNNKRWKQRVPTPTSTPRVCDFCGYEPKIAHKQGKCPAKGKKCNACQKKHHFKHAKVCPNKDGVRQVDDSSASDSEDSVAGRVEEVHRVPAKAEKQELVEVTINGVPVSLRVDSGCQKVLLPENVYRTFRHTTRLIPTKVKLRPYGTKDCLEVKGRAKVELQAARGQTFETFVYVVKGHQVEALLGLEASVALGILSINPQGEDVNTVAATQYT